MTSFHALTVTDIRQETPDCVSIAFGVPADLQSTFQFTQGQYLTLRTHLNGEEVRRSYSLCVSPLDGEWRVAVKKVPGGRFSTYANDVLSVGDQLEVMPPDGRFFTQLDPAQARSYVAFAAGSGITPIMSIMKTILETEPQSQFTLFYGNQRVESIIFREQIEALKNMHLGRLSVHYLLSREHPGSELFSGRIDQDKCRVFCEKLIDPQDVDDFFLCGPEEMILAVREELMAQGVERSRIHLELFGTTKGKKPSRQIDADADTTLATIELIQDGQTITFPMLASDDSILDAALRQGADLPFACKGGVCCTCRAKIEEGAVDMDVNYALEPDEVEAGFVLTCQSQPKTERVVVSFDA